MLARKQDQHIGDYVSDRVYDGTRSISEGHAAQLRANHKRTHGAHVTSGDKIIANVKRAIARVLPR